MTTFRWIKSSLGSSDHQLHWLELEFYARQFFAERQSFAAVSRSIIQGRTPVAWKLTARVHAVSGVFRQNPTAEVCIQLIEECVQPTVTRLTSGHLLQDFVHFRRGVLDRPADLTFTDVGIATVV